MLKYRFQTIAVVAATVAAGMSGCGGAAADKEVASSQSKSVSTTRPTTRNMKFHTSEVTDFSDLRKLAGYSDAVVEARVVSVAGYLPARGEGATGDAPPYPQTQFKVDVVRELKGHLLSPILTQLGGRDEQGTNVTVNSEPALQSGSTYLLFVTQVPTTGLQLVVPQLGSEPLAGASADSILSTVSDAIDHQIPFDPSAAPGNSGG